MNIEVRAGNILDVPADVMISTANPWFQMTGGVNLGIMVRAKGEFVFEDFSVICETWDDRMLIREQSYAPDRVRYR